MLPSSEQINFFVATLVKNNYKTVEIHKLLSSAWGEENVIHLRRLQVIAKEYRTGERTGVKRKAGSGRPQEVHTDENVTSIQEIIMDDPHISLNTICCITGLTRSAAYRILTEDLGKQSMCARWIPHKLTDDMKVKRVDGAQRLLHDLHGNVMVIDEKWIYSEPMPPKQNNCAWVDPGGDGPRQPRRIIADKKFHIIVAISFRCEHYFEVLEPGQNVNAHRYVQFLEGLQHCRRQNALTIMHDNARPHTANMTEAFLAANNIQRIPQPPYSPDMNLLDRFIFRNMESKRSKRMLKNLAEVEAFIADFLGVQQREKLLNEFNKFREELLAIIAKGGDYL
jgi:hypothetical protein